MILQQSNRVIEQHKPVSGKKVVSQKGATLLEALSFLAIAAIIVVGATTLLKSSFSSSDVNEHAKELVALRTQIKSYLSGQSNGYINATNTNLIAAGLIPSTLAVSGTNITNKFGGAVSITGTASNFTITTDLIPPEACKKLIPALTGFTSIQVGSATAVTHLPYDAGQAITDCGSGNSLITLIGN